MLEYARFQQGMLAQLLDQSKRLLHELFNVHLRDQAIASEGDQLLTKQNRLNNISQVTFMGTPHFEESLNAWSPYPKEKLPSPYDAMSAEEISCLSLSAAHFVSTFRRIEPEANILSGYQQSEPKKSMLKRIGLWSRSRSKTFAVTREQAFINIAEEIISPIDIDTQQIFSAACESSFRELIAECIMASVDSYRRQAQSGRVPTVTIEGPESSERGSASLQLRTPSTSSGSATQEMSGSAGTSYKRSSRKQPARPLFPLVFPKSSVLCGPAHYQPRPEIASELERSLLPSQVSRSSASNLLAYLVTGLGGIGKTELVRHFAARNQEEFDAIFFVIADQRERLFHQYAQIALCLGLIDDRYNPDPENGREKLKLWLENPVKTANDSSTIPSRRDETGDGKVKWLLILDNADNAQVLMDFWPRSGFGSVIVTSRDPSIQTSVQPYPIKTALTPLAPKDAAELLKKITQNFDSTQSINDAAIAIVERLEGLPLAIDQVGSIINRRHLSLPEFVQDYAQPSQFQKLYHERCIASGLLYEAAWWQCERRECSESKPLAELATEICELRSPDGKSIHNDPAAFDWHLVSIWACHIYNAQIIGDGKTAFHFSQIRCKNAEEEFSQTGILRAFLPATYNDLGQSYAMNRLYVQALPYFDKSAELMAQLPKFKKDWLVSSYYRKAITYHCLEKFEEAAEIITKAIEYRELAIGYDDRSSSRTGLLYYIFGNIRKSQGFYDEAYSLHHRAYLQCRLTSGPSSLAALKCSQKLAEHYARYDLDEDARPYLQKILQICGERSDRRQEVVEAAFTLSELFFRKGNIDEAHFMREKAAAAYAGLRPEDGKTSYSLEASDVARLVSFDYF
ncbi:MAG: hypothetical protein M1822_003409 [Bathelium mastoideum]|nr:MAG: hypothetical protein M1822_003409 [Bathelium mastoideum]